MPIVLAAALAIGGCTSLTLFEPDGAAMSGAQVDALAKGTDISAASEIDVKNAHSRRQEALAELRRQGDKGGRAADLLSQGFPSRYASVPVLVRIGRVDGVETMLVVEAFGGRTGRLQHKRLWLLDWKTGRVLRADSWR